MIYQERLTAFDMKSLSPGHSITEDDLKKLNDHFGLDTLSQSELTNFDNFAAIWFFAMTKNLDGERLDEKLKALDKLSMAIGVYKAKNLCATTRIINKLRHRKSSKH